MLRGPFGDYYNGSRFVSKIHFFIWLKRHQLLWLWGLVSRKFNYHYRDLCGRQKGLMLGFQTYFKFLKKIWVLYFRSITSLKFLKNLSASVFCVPGMCATDTHIFCEVHQHHTYSSFAISLGNTDLIPSL